MRPFDIDDFRDGPRRWPLWPVVGALVVAWLALGWPWLSGAVTVPWDAKAHFQPQMQFLADSLARGDSPFWAPYVFSGHPQIADPQSLIFSPPFLVLALFNGSPSLHAADVTVLATILVGALAVLLFFRERRWHWAAAVLAALSFAFGAAMAWRIQHTGQVLSLAYLPVALLWLTRALERRSLGYGIASGLAAAAIVLGRDQVGLLAIYLLAAYAVGWLLSAPSPLAAARSAALPLAGGAAAGIAVIALPILMTALVAAQSNRPSIDFEGAGRGSLHPALLFTLFAPDAFGSSGEMAEYWGPPSFRWKDTGLFIAQNVGQLYIGAAPVLLLLIALVSGVAFARQIRFFTIALAVMLIYALGWYTPVFRVLHGHLPGVDLFRRPADAVFLIGYLAAVVAGYACHRLLTATLPPQRAWQWVLVAIVPLGSFAALVALAVHFDTLTSATPPLIEAAVLMAGGGAALATAAWLYPLRPVAAGLVLIAFTVADLAVSNGPGGATALPPAHYDVLEPKTRSETIALIKSKMAAVRSDTRRDRIELVGMGFHWPNASLTHRLENTLGYNPVRLGAYSRAIGAEDHSVSTRDRKFPPLFPSYRSALADLLGLRWIASGAPIEEADKTLRPGDLTLVARTADGYVYENPRALPRVLFATQAVVGDFAAILDSGAWPSTDFATTVVFEQPPATPETARRPGSVRIVSYRHAEVTLEADSPDGGFVVLNDIWHPWWFAEVGGRPADMRKANVLFRAVAVPPGRHTVRFVFRPVQGAVAEALARWRGPHHPPASGTRTP